MSLRSRNRRNHRNRKKGRGNTPPKFKKFRNDPIMREFFISGRRPRRPF
jgi:hypothetical protein